MEELFHLRYFDKFKGKDIFIDYLEDKKSDKAKFVSFQKYQIFTQQKNNLVIHYKIAISTFSFIKPYPKKLIEFTGDKEPVKAGKWKKNIDI